MFVHIRKPQFWLLVGILLLASYLRLSNSYVAEFKYDEAMISRRAIALAQHGIWPASTISSIPGIPQPPIKALLLAIPYAFTRNPAIAVIFQGLLGAATVFLAYWFGKRYFNDEVGLLSAAFLAGTPWVIFYDRKLWSQNVPFFTFLMVIGLYLFVIDRKRLAIIPALGLLGLLIGFYLGNIALAGVIILGLAAFWRPAPGDDHSLRASSKPIVVAILVLVITLVPYAIEFSTGRADLSKARSSTRNSPRIYDLLGQVRMAAMVGTGEQYHALAGDKFPDYYRSLPLPAAFTTIDTVLVYFTLAAVAYLLWKTAVGYRNLQPGQTVSPRYGILAIWFIVPVTVWTVMGMVPYPHRYIMITPVQAIACAILLVDAFNWLGRKLPSLVNARIPILSAIVAITLIWHSVEVNGMYNFQTSHPGAGGSGAPLWKLWEGAERARALSIANDVPIAIYTEGDDPEVQGPPAVWEALLGDRDLYLIKDPLMTLDTPRGFVELQDFGNGTLKIEMHSPSRIANEAGLARLANGIDLLSVTPNGLTSRDLAHGEITLTLKWRIWNTPSAPIYNYTTQLYDATGSPVTKSDGSFLKSSYWHVGDVLTTTISLQLPSATSGSSSYTLVVAMYSFLSETSIQGVDVLDIAGNPAGQQIVIQLK